MIVYLKESIDEPCKIPRAALEDASLITQLEYSCIMQIEIDKEVYFCEGICPLEFLHVFRKWDKERKAGIIKDFIYNTEDDINNPVLRFKINKEGWKIFSCWERHHIERIFKLQDIMNFFELFKMEIGKFII